MRIIILSLLLIPFTVLSQGTEAPSEKQAILDQSRAFSSYYMQGDFEKLANTYTADGKILPPGARIIEGRQAIKKRWELPEGVRILLHEASPTDIQVLGDIAYDAGYYRGITQQADGSESSWQGKYLIIWKKVDGEWKIHYDIWNNVNKEE